MQGRESGHAAVDVELFERRVLGVGFAELALSCFLAFALIQVKERFVRLGVRQLFLLELSLSDYDLLVRKPGLLS